MNKKILLLIISLLFITGCTTTYNLNIEDSVIYENINFNVGKDFNLERISKIKQYNYFLGNFETYYDFSSKENKNSYDISYNYKYDFDNFTYSRVLNECFTAFNIFKDKEKNTFEIVTSDKFLCSTYEDEIVGDVLIQFKTNHKVLEHNADSVKDGTYIWKYKSSIKNKPINFKISDEVENTVFNDIKDNAITFLWIVGAISIIGIIIFIYIIIKNKTANKI